ncbi:MAG: hypothetical protein M1834_009173 [Cirrosporium novae-zelandiae]|nr:MAG: hypothetical protein M1834_009173 [Cirrosporium novae-zelandiae]
MPGSQMSSQNGPPSEIQNRFDRLKTIAALTRSLQDSIFRKIVSGGPSSQNLEGYTYMNVDRTEAIFNVYLQMQLDILDLLKNPSKGLSLEKFRSYPASTRLFHNERVHQAGLQIVPPAPPQFPKRKYTSDDLLCLKPLETGAYFKLISPTVKSWLPFKKEVKDKFYHSLSKKKEILEITPSGSTHGTWLVSEALRSVAKPQQGINMDPAYVASYFRAQNGPLNLFAKPNSWLKDIYPRIPEEAVEEVLNDICYQDIITNEEKVVRTVRKYIKHKLASFGTLFQFIHRLNDVNPKAHAQELIAETIYYKPGSKSNSLEQQVHRALALTDGTTTPEFRRSIAQGYNQAQDMDQEKEPQGDWKPNIDQAGEEPSLIDFGVDGVKLESIQNREQAKSRDVDQSIEYPTQASIRYHRDQITHIRRSISLTEAKFKARMGFGTQFVEWVNATIHLDKSDRGTDVDLFVKKIKREIIFAKETTTDICNRLKSLDENDAMICPFDLALRPCPSFMVGGICPMAKWCPEEQVDNSCMSYGNCSNTHIFDSPYYVSNTFVWCESHYTYEMFHDTMHKIITKWPYTDNLPDAKQRFVMANVRIWMYEERSCMVADPRPVVKTGVANW